MSPNSVTETLSELVIDGVAYRMTKTSKKKPAKKGPAPITTKIDRNSMLQKEELTALGLLYEDRFKVVDLNARKFSVSFLLRGVPDAILQFEFPSLYPSDVPPTYHLEAPWVREKQRKELAKALSQIVIEKFGQCIIHLWVDKITEFLKQENQELKQNPVEEEEVKVKETITPVVDDTPSIFEGETIRDRGSSFAPYLAVVKSESDVQKVLAKLNSQSKIASAWRNTYAYRYDKGGGKLVEVGEDGGEPKAGRNLLQRLINYKANNVFVFLSRKIGGRMLGSDRFKHLNDAADEVLTKCGYKQPPAAKGKAAQTTNDKKKNKKKKT